MGVDLSHLKPARGALKDRKRLGRGVGSGLGKTSGRGHKGAGARSGGAVTPGFEGGQMPLQRRLPKRGFRNPSRAVFEVVSVGRLEEKFAPGTFVDSALLRRERMVRGKGPVKILSDGEVTKALTLRVEGISAKAREKVIAAGGTVEVVASA
jgi:large subunit ribosomal protein L15